MPQEPGAAQAGPARVFMFRASSRRLCALSVDPTGGNIPRHSLGAEDEWTFVRVLDLLVGELRSGFDPDEVARALREDGYALIGEPFHAD
ncbi:hypothetical protein [Phenylobacterium sp.]|uniref:hypothetical protein n=1 Tax=Phenylobacterium sp. TaxID=1871053 RepID=UPI00301C8A1A